MEYITTRQASERWGISLRRVQDQCRCGMIPGAKRAQRDWLIPADACRPPRAKRGERSEIIAENPAERYPVSDFLLMGPFYTIPGTAQQIIDSASDKSIAALAKMQLAYYQGNIDKAYSLLQHAEWEIPVEAQAAVSVLIGVCAMYRGDVRLWQDTRMRLLTLPCDSPSARDKLDFWLAVYDSSIYDNATFPTWFRKGRLSVLPNEYSALARFYYMKYLFVHTYDMLKSNEGHDKNVLQYMVSSLPLVGEPLIAQTEREGAVISEIQLRLLCAAAYHNSGRDEDAIEHIDRAIALALPDRLFAPLAENRASLDFLLDDRLAVADSVALREVRSLCRRLMEGWTVLHNAVMGRNFYNGLTAREREVCRLVLYGLSNSDISKRLHISVNAVKQALYSAMGKTGATRRAELASFL